MGIQNVLLKTEPAYFPFQVVKSDDGEGNLVAYDSGNPTTGWTAPMATPFSGLWLRVEFSDYYVNFKHNGTTWIELNKELKSPTSTSDLTNDGDGLTPFAIESEVVAVEIGNDIQDGINGKKGAYLSLLMKTSEIKQAYESNSNTNAFTDSEKNKLSDLFVTPNQFTGTDTEKIQSALNFVNSAGGGTVYIPSGTWNLVVNITSTNAATFDCCLRVYSNTKVIIDGTLKLIDDQQTTRPINLIEFGTATNITIEGVGTIDANASGQSGDTLGYGQITSGNCIYGNESLSDITIKDIICQNAFSNGIHIQGVLSSFGNTNIKVENVKTRNCGEHISLTDVNGCLVYACSCIDSTGVCVGDYIQVVRGRNWQVVGCYAEQDVNNTNLGSLLDFGGSNNGIVSSCISKYIRTPFSISEDSFGNDCYKCSIIGCKATGVPSKIGQGISIRSNGTRDILISNCEFNSFDSGLLLGNSTDQITGNFDITGSKFDGNTVGIRVFVIKNVTISNCSASNNSSDGILMNPRNGTGTLADCVNFNIVNTTANENGQYGLNVSNTGSSSLNHSGKLSVIARDNAGLVGNSTYENLNVIFVNPTIVEELEVENIGYVFQNTGKIDPWVSGVTRMAQIHTQLRKINGGHHNQVLEIYFESTCTVFNLGSSISNINLVSAADEVFAANDYLKLKYDINAAQWFEISKSKF